MPPQDDPELEKISQGYLRFAQEEARGQSGHYERLARAVAGQRELLAFLRGLPAAKRQPNLFFAAARRLGGLPGDADALLALIRRDGEGLRALMLSRSTQTNEPARCAVLLPALARLRPPLALLEVGASAGLCLLPDRYAYDYGPAGRIGASPDAPVLACRVAGPAPRPQALPEIVWRAGLDLDPPDLRDADDMAWLETLIWPGQEARLARLRAAVEMARKEPPRVVKGDLTRDLAPLMAEAPKDATLVVLHTAVLSYIQDQTLRERFAEAMMKSRAVWISNESPRVFPNMAAKAPPPPSPGRFLLAVDGEAVAWTGPHGQSIDWFAA